MRFYVGFCMPYMSDTYLDKKILHDYELAQEKFKGFELAHRVLRPEDLIYLREQSVVYKKAVLAVQEIILPAVRKNCPVCPYGTCCRLSTPELSIYIAGSVGGFGLTDYLLVRCDSKLPAPDFANGPRNLCAFWDNGCRLPLDCRSLLCLQFFCQPIRRDLDMGLVNNRIAKVQAVVNDFSMSQLLQKDHH